MWLMFLNCTMWGNLTDYSSHTGTDYQSLADEIPACSRQGFAKLQIRTSWVILWLRC
jgi:hypothetical protein